MAYIGNTAASRFVSNRAASVYSGDGSTVAFTLEQVVTQDEDVLVSVDGVVQEPSVGYAVSSGTTLTFSAAPSTGTGNIFVQYLGLAHGTVVPPEANKGNFKSGGLFRINAQSLEENITILATENAQITGTVTVNNNITLTINDGGRLVVT